MSNRQTDRERESFGIRINGKEERKGGGGVDLGKERLSVPNIPGDEWENQDSPEKKPRLVRRDIDLDEGFTAIKAQENKTTI